MFQTQLRAILRAAPGAKAAHSHAGARRGGSRQTLELNPAAPTRAARSGWRPRVRQRQPGRDDRDSGAAALSMGCFCAGLDFLVDRHQRPDPVHAGPSTAPTAVAICARCTGGAAPGGATPCRRRARADQVEGEIGRHQRHARCCWGWGCAAFRCAVRYWPPGEILRAPTLEAATCCRPCRTATAAELLVEYRAFARLETSVTSHWRWSIKREQIKIGISPGARAPPMSSRWSRGCCPAGAARGDHQDGGVDRMA